MSRSFFVQLAFFASLFAAVQGFGPVVVGGSKTLTVVLYSAILLIFGRRVSVPSVIVVFVLLIYSVLGSSLSDELNQYKVNLDKTFEFFQKEEKEYKDKYDEENAKTTGKSDKLLQTYQKKEKENRSKKEEIDSLRKEVAELIKERESRKNRLNTIDDWQKLRALKACNDTKIDIKSILYSLSPGIFSIRDIYNTKSMSKVKDLDFTLDSITEEWLVHMKTLLRKKTNDDNFRTHLDDLKDSIDSMIDAGDCESKIIAFKILQQFQDYCSGRTFEMIAHYLNNDDEIIDDLSVISQLIELFYRLTGKIVWPFKLSISKMQISLIIVIISCVVVIFNWFNIRRNLRIRRFWIFYVIMIGSFLGLCFF